MRETRIIGVAGLIILLALILPVYASDKAVEVRGEVLNLGQNEVSMDNATFPGFYYDMDDNLGAEKLSLRLSNVDSSKSSALLSDQQDANGNRGVVYTTRAQPLGFMFAPWGQYELIGFLGDGYFSGYDSNVTEDVAAALDSVPFLYGKSKNRNLMTNEQISKILVDDNTDQTITSDSPLKLEEGYQLAIKSIDTDGNKAYLELSKNGQVIDSKVVQPSIDGARMSDKTYYYKVDIGDTKEIVQIAVHFKNAFAGLDTSIATIDGVFQISDKPIALKSEKQYDKMSISNVNPTAMSIVMDNKDNPITLVKNKDVVLMQDIHIKTADQDPIDESNPLRYYICKASTIEVANTTTSATSIAPATTPPSNITQNATASANTAENVTKNVTETSAASAITKSNVIRNSNATTNTTKTTAPAKQPGFEGVYAVTGILTVGYLLTNRKR